MQRARFADAARVGPSAYQGGEARYARGGRRRMRIPCKQGLVLCRYGLALALVPQCVGSSAKKAVVRVVGGEAPPMRTGIHVSTPFLGTLAGRKVGITYTAPL